MKSHYSPRLFLTSCSTTIVIATPSQRAEIAREFNALLLDRSGDLLLLDADEVLSTFMVK